MSSNLHAALAKEIKALDTQIATLQEKRKHLAMTLRYYEPDHKITAIVGPERHSTGLKDKIIAHIQSSGPATIAQLQEVTGVKHSPSIHRVVAKLKNESKVFQREDSKIALRE